MDTVNHVVSTMSTFFVQIQNREPVAVAGLLIVTTLVAISGWMLVSMLADDKPRLAGSAKYEEHKVCSEKDLPKAGSMKAFKIGKIGKVLLVRTSKGKISAMPDKCTHYPLSLSHGGGVLSGDRLVCPFHASCFNVETGDVEDGPSMSGLPIFETRMAGGDLYANLPVTAAGKLVEHREPCRHRVPPAGSTPGDVVVIGSGAAAAGAIETLLAGGHSGSVTVISKDRAGFWDRIKVSKAVTETDYSKKHVIIDPAKWEAAGVKLMLGYEVTTVDAAALSVSAVPCGSSSADAVEVRYDKLICASGGPARTFRADKGERFTIDGADLSNIFVLRDATDNVGVARALDEFADAERAARVVVVGSSFIGMEAAASLMSNVSDRALQSIDIIGMEAEPFERVLGLGVGRVMRRIHQDKAQAANDEATAAAGGPRDDGSPWFTQTFHMRSKTLEFEGSGGLVTGVRISTPLPSGGEETRVLPADIVVIGAGMIPATDYLSGTPAVVRNGVRVDATLKACDHIWAAGDIAEIPNTRFSTCDGDAFLRIEHWDVAIDQGRCAARNVMRELAGKAGEPFDVVPFFWTQQHGTNIRYAGHAHFVSDADTIIRGDMDAAKPKLIAFYCSDKKVLAVATLNSDPQAAAAQELFRLGLMPSRDAVEGSPDMDLAKALASRT